VRASLSIIAAALSLVVCHSAMAADLGAGADAFDDGNYAEARAQWQPLAEQGDALAQYNLALLYANGWGADRDPIKALRWFGKAADQGNAEAQYNLALMRQTGNGVPQNASEAVYWYKQAADQGLVNAQNNLALMYIEGNGVRRDRAEGVRWLARAAAQSNAEARSNRAELMASLSDVTIDGSSVNVRAKPSRSAAVRAQAGRASEALLLKRGGDWSQVWLTQSDKVGWVANFLLAGVPTQPAGEVEVGMPEQQTDDALAAEIPTAAELPQASTNTSTAGTPAEPPEVDTTTAPDTPDAGDKSQPQRQTQTLGLSQHVGWVAAVDSAEAAAGGKRMRVATSQLNVRARPNTQSQVLTQLEHNQIVDVLDQQSSWRKIRLPSGNGEGWVAAFLLAEPR